MEKVARNSQYLIFLLGLSVLGGPTRPDAESDGNF